MQTYEWLLAGIVAFILIDFVMGSVLEYLNEKSKNVPMSSVAAEIFNADEYAKSLEYGTANYKVERLTSTLNTVVMLSAIILGWFAWLDEAIRERISNNLLVTVVFFGVLILAVMLANLPVSYYSTFVIEEKFGFNKTTKKLFVVDSIKQMVLSIALGLPVIYLIAWIYQSLESQFWLVG